MFEMFCIIIGMANLLNDIKYTLKIPDFTDINVYLY